MSRPRLSHLRTLHLMMAVGIVGCADRGMAPAIDRENASALSSTLGAPVLTPLASLDWQESARNLVATNNLSPLAAARIYAALSVAEYRATLAVDDAERGDGRSAHEARRGAVAGASAQVLTFFFPAAAASFEQLLQTEGANGAGNVQPAFTRGVAIGRANGDALVERTKNDNFTAPFTGTIPVGPGLWIPNGPPAGATLSGMTPYLLGSADQFRPPPPPAFGSAPYTAALQEIRSISDTRSAGQIASAVEWNYPTGTFTPPGYWDLATANYIEAYGLDERAATHAFALTNEAMMDSFIGCFEAKYHYLMIRPPQADPGITLVFALPNHPSYPSAHSCASAAAATVLSYLFPDRTDEVSRWMIEAGLSRMYAGIHYRFDIDAGQALGTNVGRLAIARDRDDHLLADAGTGPTLGTRAEPVVVTGTGVPSIDVPAVQAAVDQGGTILLAGHFSFDQSPTKRIAAPLSAPPPGLAYAPAAEVVVSKAVTISGTSNAAEAMTTIDAGTIPFYVDAPGQRVTIRRLRFVRPTSSAILVYAVRDLEIASSKIAGVVTYKNLADGIGISTSGAPPTLAAPGAPQNVSGTLNIIHNDIDMTGGTTADNTLGIVVFGAGIAGAPVEAHVSGNRVRNTTEPAINFRQIEGRADVTHNVIATGTVAANVTRDQAIRVANTGIYRITDNVIDCQWANADAEAIGVFSNVASWPVEHAVVERNEVNMSAPAGTVFTAFSAGIGVFGFADSNVVRQNSIRGHARAALSIPIFPLAPQSPAAPADNAFIDNRLVDFTASVADIVVGPHALRTRIVGPGSVEDEGDETLIEKSRRSLADASGSRARAGRESRRSSDQLIP